METEIVLPRLVLSYYFWLSFFILFISLFARVLIQKFRPDRKMFSKVAGKLSLLAGSYLIATICWKDSNFATHALKDDLTKILLTAIGIFMIASIAELLIASRKKGYQ